jgi:hypothetical protein
MASRSPEATGNGWGDDDHGTDSTPPEAVDVGVERRPAADAAPERRIEALEAELERRDRQLQLVVDHYESLLDQGDRHDRPQGLLAHLRERLASVLGR